MLTGKRAVVTGGSRGIGRGIVDRFLTEGARIAVIARGELDAELAADQRVLHVPADLRDPSSIGAAVDAAADWFGDGIDVVVNNAGIMYERSVAELLPHEWNLMAAVNLTAPLFVIQAALPHLRARGGGSIINIGSVEGSAANPGHAAYSATKAGVHGMTRALAVDLGPDGIRCNAIAPGWIESDLSEAYLRSHSDAESARGDLIGLHPIGRIGVPDDVGQLAAFLASDRASFLTGEIIVLDGGRTVMLPSPR